MATTTTEGEVKVLGAWPSPYVMRARIALNLKGVEYEFLEETFGSKSELLLRSNPVYKKIPVLIHAGKPVSESMIIVQYVDDTWVDGPPILSADPYDRAVARFWAVYVDDKWYPCLRAIRTAETEDAKSEAASQVSAGLQLLEEAFGECSKGKGFFGGDAVGYLDIAFGSYLGWLGVSEELSGVKLLDKTKTPRLAAWAARLCAEASVKDVMPAREKLVEIAKVLQARGKAAPPAK